MVIQHKSLWTLERQGHNAFGFPPKIADIAIIGGGLKGLATMYFLSTLNVRCLLLERGTIGCGSSTRNVGAICIVPDCSPNSLKEEIIIERIRMAEKNVNMLSALVSELNFDVSLVRNGGLHLAANETQSAQLEVLHGLLVKNGIVCDELDSKQITDLVAGSDFEAALYYPGEATIHPGRLLDLLLAINRTFTSNAAVEYFNVKSIKQNDDGVEIISDRGTKVQAGAVVICTDDFQDFYPDSSIMSTVPTSALCFASAPLERISNKMPMSSRTTTGMHAWTIHDGRIVYTFRNREASPDQFGYIDDDIRKSGRFLTQYVPISKGHHYQEFMWTSSYYNSNHILPTIQIEKPDSCIVFNVGYGYSVLDLFFAGAEKAAGCVKNIINRSFGGAESAESFADRDIEG